MFIKESIKISQIFCLLIFQLLKSSEIYYKILTKFKGYGIKFLLVASLISAIITTIIIDSQINRLLNNKDDNINYIEYLANQIPVLHYKNSNLKIDNYTGPIFINNPFDNKNRNIIAIDLKNELNNIDRKSIPIILQKNNILLNINNKITSYNYKNIFEKNNITITPDEIVFFTTKTIKSFNKLYSVAIFTIIKFCYTIIDNIFNILITIIIVKFFGNNSLNLKSLIRTIIFASVPYLIFGSFITFLLNPHLTIAVRIIKIYCLFLMYKTIIDILRSKK